MQIYIYMYLETRNQLNIENKLQLIFFLLGSLVWKDSNSYFLNLLWWVNHINVSSYVPISAGLPPAELCTNRHSSAFDSSAATCCCCPTGLLWQLLLKFARSLGTSSAACSLNSIFVIKEWPIPWFFSGRGVVQFRAVEIVV